MLLSHWSKMFHTDPSSLPPYRIRQHQSHLPSSLSSSLPLLPAGKMMRPGRLYPSPTWPLGPARPSAAIRGGAATMGRGGPTTRDETGRPPAPAPQTRLLAAARPPAAAWCDHQGWGGHHGGNVTRLPANVVLLDLPRARRPTTWLNLPGARRFMVETTLAARLRPRVLFYIYIADIFVECEV